MNHAFVRGALILWFSTIILLIVVIYIVSVLIDDVGVITFTVFDAEGPHHVYIDYNINKTVWSRAQLGATSTSRLEPTIRQRDQATPFLPTNGDIEAELTRFNDLNLIEGRIFWLDYGKSLMVIHTEQAPAQTSLYTIDVNSNERTLFLTIEGLHTGTFRLSPDGNHLLLRADQDRLRRPVNPIKPFHLINLQTAKSIELGDLAFAYFSPDSQKIALGNPTEQSGRSQVSIYDIPASRMQVFNAFVSHEDTPFFPDAIPEVFVMGTNWSNDSNRLAIINRYSNQLVFISLDGERWTIEGGRLIPYSWSPNNRYLIASGFDADGNIGAFVIDTIDKTVRQIQSDVTIQTSLAELAWSPDSHHIAVLRRTPGITQQHEITVYHNDGSVSRQSQFIKSDTRIFAIGPSLRWYSGTAFFR